MNDFERGLSRYFTEEQLKKVRSVSVGIAGAGGLGSNCALHLVRSGFRNVTVCDFDTVEGSNLNRQFYFLDQVGLPKVEALKANLLKINPAAAITAVSERVTPENALRVFAACDAVVEAFDTVDDKRLMAEAFSRSGKFFVAASGLAGWGDADAIVTRQVHERFCFIGDHSSEAGPGRPPCSPRVGVAAAKEADAVLSWALEKYNG